MGENTTNSVTIASQTLSVVEYQGQRVVTLAMIDKVHERPEGTAGRNFRENKRHLVEGEDYIELTADEIRRQSLTNVFPPRTPKGIIITESGYPMLVKSFTDDLAWMVQRDLVRNYFRPKVEQPAIPSHPEALRLAADLMEKNNILINTVMVKDKELAAAKPKADALDELAALEGVHNLRSAAQQCGWPEKAFINKLVAIRWLYVHSVTGRKCAYADKIKAGLMEAKNVEVKRTGYVEGVGQPMITQKGLATLRVQIGAYLSPEVKRPFAKKEESAMT